MSVLLVGSTVPFVRNVEFARHLATGAVRSSTGPHIQKQRIDTSRNVYTNIRNLSEPHKKYIEYVIVGRAPEEQGS